MGNEENRGERGVARSPLSQRGEGEPASSTAADGLEPQAP